MKLPGRAKAVLFDLGGTHIRAAVSTPECELLLQEKKAVRNFTDGSSPEEVWRSVYEYVTEYIARVEGTLHPDAAVVLSVPGPVGPDSRLLDAPTLVGHGTPVPDIKHDIERATGRTVSLLNDLSAAAWHVSRTVADKRFLVLTVGTGIGSKIVDRDHPLGVIADVSYCGEIGHFAVTDFDDEVLCDCGGRNHVGAISSGRGILRMIQARARLDRDGFRASGCGTAVGGRWESLSNEAHIVPAALAGDPWVLEVIRQATRPLAHAVLAVWIAVGLTRVIVIGGFALALGDCYREILEGELAHLADYGPLSACRGGMVQLGRKDEEACLIGAAVYASYMK
jgi:C7-cyclitol 7-kinase